MSWFYGLAAQKCSIKPPLKNAAELSIEYKASQMNDYYGEDGGQISPNFRKVVCSYVKLFQAQRDHVHTLLGGRHNYLSGTFRENLLRQFLIGVLPKSVSVDSGFIYGFDQAQNSKQIDILVWDSSKHSAVFRAGEFVIVPPESVIAAISVKTKFDNKSLLDSLMNLQSVTELDLAYRQRLLNDKDVHLPILKIAVAYEGPSDSETALKTISKHYESLFASNVKLGQELKEIFQTFDPYRPSERHVNKVDRILPSMVVAIESNEISLLRGWGPPEDRLPTKTYGPGLLRLPYMYAQKSNITSPLEKLVYQVMRITYRTLGTNGLSLLAAWGEMHPIAGFRIGDGEELMEEAGVRLLNPENIGIKP